MGTLGALGSSEPSVTTGFTVIPPADLISEQAEVELRLAIHNSTNVDSHFQVSFYVDTVEPHNLIATSSVSLSPGEQTLVSTWWDDLVPGAHQLLYTVQASQDNAQMIAQGSWPIRVVASETRALPLLQAGWLDPGALIRGVYPQTGPINEQYVRDKIDAMHRIGMNTIVITYPEYILNGWGPFYPSQIAELTQYGRPLPFDVVGTILDQADKNGQRVFVGIGRGPDLTLTFDGAHDPERVERVLNLSKAVATELWELYGHYKSFYGWYLTHEVADIAFAGAYYNPLADFLHSFSMDKPVMVAPSGTPIISTEILKNSSVDIFAYQDAVGAGYIPYQYTFEPDRRIEQLDEVYEHYRATHVGSGKHLWADLEIWQMDGPTYGYSYPAPWERVLRQIEVEQKYVSMITAYEVFGMMENPLSTGKIGGDRAVSLFEQYQEHVIRFLETLD